MWCKWTHTLAPLTKLWLTKVKFKWTDIENNAFTDMNKIVGRDVLIYYPNLSELFTIHTDSRKMQIGGVISQNGKTIAF